MMTAIRRTLAALLLTALLLPVAPASADDPDDLREARIQQQMIHLLQAPSVHAQERALQMLIQYAHADTYGYAFFHPVTPKLADVVRSGSHPSLRIMATSALYHIGTPTAVQALESLETDDALPADVKKAVERALRQQTIDEARTEQQRFTDRVLWADWL